MNIDSSNAGMNQCTSVAIAAADKVLNSWYQADSKVWIGTDEPDASERKKRVLNAQRAWIAFRDAECQLQAASMLGGSGEGLAGGMCLYELTRQRIGQLDNDLEMH